MTYEFQVADIRDVVECVVDEFRSMCAERQIEFRYERPQETMLAVVDSDRLQQVVRNLLSNATKFSPSPGTVSVRLRQVGQSLLISVRDKGLGIPPNELETVFDKFVQSSKTKSNKGGTGLGLAICREIITGHKGRIWVENNEGAGCVFYVELPIVDLASPPITDSLELTCST